MARATIETVKYAIVEEHEREGRVDLSRWVSAHPKFREEILDFTFWLGLCSRVEEEPAGQADGTWTDDGKVVASAPGRLRRTLAIVTRQEVEVREDLPEDR